MNYKTFKNFEDAENAELSLNAHGWPGAERVQMYIPDDDNADDDGNVWIISVPKGTGDRLALRNDGHVR